MPKGIKIAQIGTFDVENYGDLLFPNLLKHELSKRLDIEELHLFSPIGGSKPFEPQTPVYPISTFERCIQTVRYDAIIVGGGDLFRLDNTVADLYNANQIPASQLLWQAAALAAQYGIPNIWNAIGVPFPFHTEAQNQAVRAYCNQTKYLAVRDSISRQKLLDAQVAQPIEIVPDTAVALSKWIKKNDLHLTFLQLKAKYNFQFGDRYLVFQANGFNQRDMLNMGNVLKSVKESHALDVVLLPIGYCHNDHAVLQYINSMYPEHFHFIQPKLSPIELMSIIACSRMFIGSSLHGSITAFSYGVDSIAINPGIDKLDGFFEHIDRSHLCIRDVNRVESLFGQHIGYIDRYDKDYEQLLRRILRTIDRHYDVIATVLMDSKC